MFWLRDRFSAKKPSAIKQTALIYKLTTVEAEKADNQLNYDSKHNLYLSQLGGQEGTRTPNLFLVREAVYH